METDVTEQFKLHAAIQAVSLLDSGMVLGLGHGSTAMLAIKEIASKYQQGFLKEIFCIPASKAVEIAAKNLKLPLTKLDKHHVIDITIDGADEATKTLDLIKGGGGALLKEKMLAQASKREIIIADESKLSSLLGEKRAVPIEIIPFGWRYQAAFLENLGARVKLRVSSKGVPCETDQGNLILDCNFGPIAKPVQLTSILNQRAGIVEHGLFIDLADDLIIAGKNGIRHFKKQNS